MLAGLRFQYRNPRDAAQIDNEKDAIKYWFPSKDRAKIVALVMTDMPEAPPSKLSKKLKALVIPTIQIMETRKSRIGDSESLTP